MSARNKDIVNCVSKHFAAIQSDFPWGIPIVNLQSNHDNLPRMAETEKQKWKTREEF